MINEQRIVSNEAAYLECTESSFELYPFNGRSTITVELLVIVEQAVRVVAFSGYERDCM